MCAGGGAECFPEGACRPDMRTAAYASGVKVAFFTAADIEAAVPPEKALEAVRAAFIAYARGEWSMPPKVYVPAYPAGDFRAMPALGDGHALLKWVTSFPGNPANGLPTVMGLALLSNAANGVLEAVFEAGAITALRTGAAAVLAAETLGRAGRRDRSGHRRRHQRPGRSPDVRRSRPPAASVGHRSSTGAHRRGDGRWRRSRDRQQALAADLVVTVTPGHEVVLEEGALRPGQHVSLMGADGPGKSEIAVEELARVRVFCDDWTQASHNGDLVHAVEAGTVTREDVTELGAVLAGQAEGRHSPDEATAFDSTGLAIQDLALALVAFEQAGRIPAYRRSISPDGVLARHDFGCRTGNRPRPRPLSLHPRLLGGDRRRRQRAGPPPVARVPDHVLPHALYTRLARVYGWGAEASTACICTTWSWGS